MTIPASLRTVSVSNGAPYTITIGPGLLHDSQRLSAAIRGRHVLILSDSEVSPLYAAQVRKTLLHARPDLHLRIFNLPAGETSKTLEHFSAVITALAELGATRDACVFALGGGVVGDLAGFTAACWMRGIDYVQVPTTLLAMVDSSVGGKTAVDIPQGKNMVGAFHPPRAVIADTDTLDTLPLRELRAGFSEIIKYGAIRDPVFFQWLQAEREALLARMPTALAKAIARSCEHKADIVGRDPLEKGERVLLNLGHTFGHAIETEQGYSTPGSNNLNHGEAIAVGMVLAARLSTALGLAPAQDTETLKDLLNAYGLPTALPSGLTPEALLGRMRLDKKNIAGRLRLVLWRGIGRAEAVPDVDEAAVRHILSSSTSPKH
ncbi:MAG TPA: 3-dehydroquinate synthase [Xylella sp.]